MNLNSWYVWVVEKQITTRISQGATILNSSSIFNTVFCTFLWGDCNTIFTVLPETQKLNLPAISHWSVHKTPSNKIGKLTFETSLLKTRKNVQILYSKAWCLHWNLRLSISTSASPIDSNLCMYGPNYVVLFCFPMVYLHCIKTYGTLSRARLHFGPCYWSIFLNVYLKEFLFIMAKVEQWKE